MGFLFSTFLTFTIGGCRVKLTFAAELGGVIERIKSILSNVYDERVQNELMRLIKQGASND